jgi:glycosyltransferase involved in cell wall biosynthesis
VDVDKFELDEKKEDFYLTASRLVPYKKVDLIVDAFSKLPDKKLIVVGSGPESENIKSKLRDNIHYLGYQNFESLKSLMQKAKAFVFAAEEDFGIIVLEAMACGTPVIALNKGGTAETVLNNFTGIHFNAQTEAELINAVLRFENNAGLFSPKEISNYAKKFSRIIFEKNIKNYVLNKSEDFFK